MIRDWPLHSTFCQTFSFFSFLCNLPVLSRYHILQHFVLPLIIVLLFVTDHKTRAWAQSSCPKLFFMWRPRTPHLHQRVRKVYYSHNEIFWGEQSWHPSQSGMAWARGGWWLCFLLWLEGGAAVSVPVHGFEFVLFELPQWHQEKLLPSHWLAQVEGKKGRGWGGAWMISVLKHQR